jgi:hypothetical protein
MMYQELTMRWRDPFTHTPEGSLERWLMSDDPVEQSYADEALARMGPDAAFAALMRILDRERALRRKGGRFAGAALWGGLSGVALSLGQVIDFPVIAAILGSASGPLVLALYGLKPSRLQRRIWARMGSGLDLRAIPLLVDAWMPWERDVHQIVSSSLTRLLPRLTENDRDLLTEAQWKSLEVLLRGGATGHTIVGEELTRALLRAFGNARPANARAVLEGLAHPATAPEHLTPEQLRLQQMARNYLVAWDVPRPPHISPPATPEPVRRETAVQPASAAEQREQTVGRAGSL